MYIEISEKDAAYVFMVKVCGVKNRLGYYSFPETSFNMCHTLTRERYGRYTSIFQYVEFGSYGMLKTGCSNFLLWWRDGVGGGTTLLVQNKTVYSSEDFPYFFVFPSVKR
jgi:hypothetical protein